MEIEFVKIDCTTGEVRKVKMEPSPPPEEPEYVLPTLDENVYTTMAAIDKMLELMAPSIASRTDEDVEPFIAFYEMLVKMGMKDNDSVLEPFRR